jgi:hypothetical protein
VAPHPHPIGVPFIATPKIPNSQMSVRSSYTVPLFLASGANY